MCICLGLIFYVFFWFSFDYSFVVCFCGVKGCSFMQKIMIEIGIPCSTMKKFVIENNTDWSRSLPPKIADFLHSGTGYIKIVVFVL